jgi:hypothetical protein
VTTDKPSGESNRVVIGPDIIKHEPDQQQSNNIKTRPSWKKFNDTLELKKVPREFNNITKLNDYFQKFGNIVNIQVMCICNFLYIILRFNNASLVYRITDLMYY